MQLRFSSIFYIYLTALAVLTWTSSAQGAAINRASSSSRRDTVEASGYGIDIWNDEVLRRDDASSTTNIDGPQEQIAERATGESNTVENDSLKNSRRWYTLVEIAEEKESE